MTCAMSVVSPDTLVFSTNKTDHHDIAAILLKVELNTITLTFNPFILRWILKCVGRLIHENRFPRIKDFVNLLTCNLIFFSSTYFYNPISLHNQSPPKITQIRKYRQNHYYGKTYLKQSFFRKCRLDFRPEGEHKEYNNTTQYYSKIVKEKSNASG